MRKNRSDPDKFKLCINTLLSSTFILRDADSDRELYDYMAEEGGFLEADNYLRKMGWSVYQDKQFGIYMLTKTDELDEILGHKCAPPFFMSPDKDFVLCVLVLAKIYIENYTSKTENVIFLNDFYDRMRELGVARDRKVIEKNTLKTLRSRKLIDLKISELDRGNKNPAIRLYPSLLFGLPKEEMLAIAEEGMETERNNRNAEDV